MLSKAQKATYREELFRHLDGLATAPTAYALHNKGVLQLIVKENKITLQQIVKTINANVGYLNVALRVLASQGWLNYDVDNKTNTITLSSNTKTSIAINHIYLYEDVVNYLKATEKYGLRSFNKELLIQLETVVKRYKKQFNLQLSNNPEEREVQQQILKHIEGVLVGPTVVLLGMGGMFHKYFMEASFKPEEYHKDPKTFEKVLDFLTHLNWFTKKNGTYSFTEKGLFFAKRASAYGVTVSYIPTLRNLDKLIFEDPSFLRDISAHQTEVHVDREMNVWGSGGAHAAYFKKIDEIIIKIFNKEPIKQQPKGILDMGCGNGAFLIHLFNLIEKQTKRGQYLEEHPLFLVGVDYNETALKVTRANIIQADIWAKVIWGDIGNPAQLNKTLKENYNINLKDLLNVRTFLDHNRIWSEPENEPGEISTSTGAFAHKGALINNNKVYQNLVEHFKKWKPYVEKYGLLVIELHTINPTLAANNLGKTAATAYDATHGYSDQYIVEIDVFKKAAAKAGLLVDESTFAKFPNSDLATVSISLLKGNA